MENKISPIKRYGKLVLIALIIAVIADMIGAIKIDIGIGTLVIFPLVIATIIGGVMGPDLLKLFKFSECQDAGDLVLVVIAPFMARMGVSAGGNLPKLLDAIGATYSINRDGNLALSTDYWGPTLPKRRALSPFTLSALSSAPCLWVCLSV